MEQKKVYKKAIFPIILAVLQVLAVLILILGNLISGGYTEGMFDIEDVLFDGISSLANKSDYELVIEAGRTYSFLVMLVIGGILLVALLRSKARKDLPGALWSRVGVQTVTNVLFLFPSMLLFLYSFHGITRCALYVAMLAGAVIYLCATAKLSVRVGGTALLIYLITFLAAFWLTWFIAPLFGGLFAIFGDIVSFLVLLCLLGGGGTYEMKIIRVWII